MTELEREHIKELATVKEKVSSILPALDKVEIKVDSVTNQNTELRIAMESIIKNIEVMNNMIIEDRKTREDFYKRVESQFKEQGARIEATENYINEIKSFVKFVKWTLSFFGFTTLASAIGLILLIKQTFFP